MLDLYYYPVYNSYPVTYDYIYEKNFKWDLYTNMPSYSLLNRNGDNPLKTLRIVFYDGFSYKFYPAMYCKDYYAKEITDEKSEHSDSTFYTNTYRDPIYKQYSGESVS